MGVIFFGGARGQLCHNVIRFNDGINDHIKIMTNDVVSFGYQYFQEGLTSFPYFNHKEKHYNIPHDGYLSSVAKDT